MNELQDAEAEAIKTIALAICKIWPKAAGTCAPVCFFRNGEAPAGDCQAAAIVHGWRARKALDV